MTEQPAFTPPVATRPPRTTTSADGTTIAFDLHEPAGSREGDDTAPFVVLVGGATTTRLMSEALAAALAERGVAAATYDRRGRGDSGDTPPYEVAREVDDLAAVVDACRPGGRAAAVVGHSSGAALVLQAAAAGAPLDVAVAFEPPYRVDGSPPLAPDYCDVLDDLTAQGRVDDAFTYFQTAAIGMPEEVVAGMRGTALWEFFKQTAPTLRYDARCLGGNRHPLPEALVASIGVPVVALASTGSPAWLVEPARRLPDVAREARFALLDGEFHHVPDEVLAPVLVDVAHAGR